MPPLVSVIIPSYDRANMLTRAVKSALAQDYPHYEIIIVDDGSKDNTPEIARSFHDDRIRYLRQPENKGASASRNIGMKNARGEYIAFLDSDDEYLPPRLSRLVRVYESLNPAPGLLFTNMQEINDRGEQTHTIPQSVSSGYVTVDRAFPANIFAPTSCWMINRNVLQEEFFDENIHTIEDCDYFARIVRRKPAYFLNEPLVLKHVHHCKQGRVPFSFAEQTRERMLDKWLPEMKKDKKFLVSFYCTMAKDLIRRGKKKKARDILGKAWQVDPCNIKILMQAIKSLGA